jgi:hypothetical protein
MAEYIEVPSQNVALNNPIVFSASIPCTKGYIYHEDGTANFTLRGVTNNCFARYQLNFQANAAIPTGGAVTPIAVAFSVNGEVRPSSLAIVTPAAVEEYSTLSNTAIITVPKGCCFNVSVKYVSGVTDGATTPTPAINVQNANLTISRIA